MVIFSAYYSNTNKCIKYCRSNNGELDQAINAMNYMIGQTDIVVSHFVIGSLHMIVNMLSD